MPQHYLPAHQIAIRPERAAVESAGVSWGAYQRFMKKYEKPIELERLQRVPRSLDLTPYRDEKDIGLLKRLVAGERGAQGMTAGGRRGPATAAPLLPAA